MKLLVAACCKNVSVTSIVGIIFDFRERRWVV